MAGAETKTQKKNEVAEALETGFDALIKKAIPPGAQARLLELQEAHDSIYIDHEDKVAVLDLSTAAVDKIDAIPGFFFEESRPRLFTAQGLIKIHRYPVVINFVPKTEYIYEFAIIDKAEWESHIASQGGPMMSQAQMVAGLMRRSAGE